MKGLDQHIKTAEEKWLTSLFKFCIELFGTVQIPSHDHTHHLRVWNYSKEILGAISNSYKISYDKVEACLIASLFHDTGLTKTIKENHGQQSKQLCIQYFEENHLSKPHQWDDILNTIEKHDDKNYKLNSTAPDDILSIVCNADDLDAFGNIGTVRYTEIYLLRGNSLIELPDLVLQNIDKRFSNFEKTYKGFKTLYEKHKENYLITKRFFENLQKEII